MRLILILIFFTLFLFSKEATLKLDTKGHTSIIRDIIVTKNGDIISASDDKTIRIWDSKSGKEKRKILGQIGDGEGEIYAIALSSDEKYLAVGGYLSNNDYEPGKIRIYNYQSGKLLRVLKSHTNVVFDLAFSTDGKYLVSGSSDFSVKVWNMDSFTLKESISFHKDTIYGVGIIKKGEDYHIYSAGYDNKIALHSLKKGFINSYIADFKLQYLAISEGYIATNGYGRETLIFNHNLNLKRKIKSETEPVGVAFDESGEYMVTGVGVYPHNVNLYSVKNNFKKVTSFKKHTTLTMAVAFLKDRVVSGGGDDFEIYIWSRDGKVIREIKGVGNTIWSVGIDGDRVGWGNIFDKYRGENSLQKSLNLKTFKVKKLFSDRGFNRISSISTRNGRYSLSHRRGGDYGYSDAILDINRGVKTISSITKSDIDGYQHRCYGFYKNYIISGGNNGHLKVYNIDGDEVASLISHTGEIWTIATEGNTLVSGGSDQIIKLWNLKEIENHSEIYPYLNIFISKDDEWVIWSKSGYYVSSAYGSQYIGYYINHGNDKEAEYLTIDKYSKELYRPDIIKNIVKLKSEKKAIETTNVNFKNKN